MTTRDRERLDAVAMNTQRMDNSVAPVTGASEGGGKVVARQLTAVGVTVYVGSPASPTPRASSAPGTSWLTRRASRLTAKLPNSAGVEASAVCVRRAKED